MRVAERQAHEIVDDAREREREIRLGAEDYADEVLGNLEVNLDKFLAAVRRGRERLQTPSHRPRAAGLSTTPAAVRPTAGAGRYAPFQHALALARRAQRGRATALL